MNTFNGPIDICLDAVTRNGTNHNNSPLRTYALCFKGKLVLGAGTSMHVDASTYDVWREADYKLLEAERLVTSFNFTNDVTFSVKEEEGLYGRIVTKLDGKDKNLVVDGTTVNEKVQVVLRVERRYPMTAENGKALVHVPDSWVRNLWNSDDEPIGLEPINDYQTATSGSRAKMIVPNEFGVKPWQAYVAGFATNKAATAMILTDRDASVANKLGLTLRGWPAKAANKLPTDSHVTMKYVVKHCGTANGTFTNLVINASGKDVQEKTETNSPSFKLDLPSSSDGVQYYRVTPIFYSGE